MQTLFSSLDRLQIRAVLALGALASAGLLAGCGGREVAAKPADTPLEFPRTSAAPEQPPAPAADAETAQDPTDLSLG